MDNINNKNLLNAVYGSIILVLVVAAFSMFVYVRAYSSSVGPNSYRSFGVVGEGKVVAVPDVATFNFSVINQGGNDLSKLQADNTAKVNTAIEFLKKNGIKAEDIQTSGYNVSPRYQGYNCNAVGVCPPASIVGYEVNQTVSVKVRDFEVIGKVLTGVVEAGANSVSGISFTVDNIKKLENEARGLAIKQAREMAKEVAKAGGFKLGTLLSVDEMTDYPGNYAYGMGGDMVQMKEMSVVASPRIEAGSQEIVIKVNARYQIR